MSIGLNILAMPQPDIPALLDWLIAARPAYTLVMDGLDVAARVAMTGTQIVFRRYRTDDSRLADTTTPAAFLDSVADLPASYIVQAGNEPGGDQAQFVDWTVELIRLANQRGRRLMVGNWSVGNPDDVAVANGWYDPVLTALAGTKHLLGAHEYFWDKPAEENWFIGRYRHLLKRTDQLRIARPNIVISEHGRDLGGGDDGWRAQGWSEADYARRLSEAQTVYEPDGICALVFCYGAGFDDRWRTYDVQGANELLARMAAMNGAGETDEMNVPGYRQAVTKQPGAKVNLRGGPGLKYQPVAFVVTGDYVKRLPGSTVSADGYTWAAVAVDKDANSHQHGWVATEVIDV